MKFTHRTQGPRKAVGNGFIPNRIEPRKKHKRPLVVSLPHESLPNTLEGILKKILHEIADGV